MGATTHLRLMRWIICIGCAALAVGASAQTATQSVERTLGNDFFAAGNNLLISKPVAGDLMAFGGSVGVSAPVEGDLIAAGGSVRVEGPLNRSAYVAGGQVNLNNKISHNARLAGGQVNIAPSAEVGGNVSIAGGQVNISGKVQGYVQVGGGRVTLNGPVANDVVVSAGSVVLGPNARIGGKLRYASRAEIERDAAAQITGGLESLGVSGGWPVPAKMEHHVGRSGGWAWTIGLMIFAALFVAALPGFSNRVSTGFTHNPALTALVGFITLVCIPAAALLLVLTIIGIPLALVLFISLPALLLLGYLSTAIALGDWAVRRFKSGLPAATVTRAATAAGAVLLLAVLSLIPFLGNAVIFAALICGIGALAMQLPFVRQRTTPKNEANPADTNSASTGGTTAT
jgi:hypothetical protein